MVLKSLRSSMQAPLLLSRTLKLTSLKKKSLPTLLLFHKLKEKEKIKKIKTKQHALSKKYIYKKKRKIKKKQKKHSDETKGDRVFSQTALISQAVIKLSRKKSLEDERPAEV